VHDAFAPIVPLVEAAPLPAIKAGSPSELLPGGGQRLDELLRLAGLPGAGGLPPPRRGIHGIVHLRMVAALGVKLARAEGWDPSRPDHLRDLWCLWAAGCLHDLGRHGDGVDWGHAERGAAIAEGYLEGAAVEREAADAVVRLIRIHGERDESALTPLQKLFKDADGLERHRLSPFDCEKKKLRTPTARLWFGEVWSLYWGGR
jgi:hypothetical protein